jgi:hypothetical protein
VAGSIVAKGAISLQEDGTKLREECQMALACLKKLCPSNALEKIRENSPAKG